MWKGKFIIGASLGLAALQSSASCAEPVRYFAHPQHAFSTVEEGRGVFLLTEALHLIALVYDSTAKPYRAEIVARLIGDPAIREVLGATYGEAPDSKRLSKRLLMGAIQTWLESYPIDNAKIGAYAIRSWTASYTRVLAHSLIRLAYELAGFSAPTEPRQIIEESVSGVTAIDGGDLVRQLRSTLASACSMQADESDEDPKMPMAYRWGRVAWRYVPGARSATEYFLGDGKTCESLAQDLMDIVDPKESPLRSLSQKYGQLEGTSKYLARIVLENGFESSQLLLQLHSLSRLDRLDSRLDEASAVKAALNKDVPALELVRLLAMATHNHGLEYFIEKVALLITPSPEQSVAYARKALSDLNHFYGLLAQHRRERKDLGVADSLVQAARPYHYWGGALVACELAIRGYHPWAAKVISTQLGKIYESSTGSAQELQSPEGLAAKAEDVALHKEGAQTWGSQCSLNP